MDTTTTAPVTLNVTGLAKTYTGHGRSVEAVRDLTFTHEHGLAPSAEATVVAFGRPQTLNS